MDVSGHIPKDGIPFIDNLWYKEKYAKDPTDASTISTEVKGKGYAKSHVLSAISYFKGKNDVEIVKTEYEFQKGDNKMLVIR